MHEIHHTEGFILAVTDVKEANRLFRIFTKDFGTISAMAQSVRREQSKLKGHLPLYGFTYLDVVRGRDMWRITSARLKTNVPFDLKQKQKRLYARTLEAIDRLYRGEEPHEELFTHTTQLLTLLETEHFSNEQLQFLDTLSLVRLFYFLGYLERDALIAAVTSGTLAQALQTIDETKHRLLVQKSHEALKASHL